jgi:excinuclease ABC subunit C
MLLPSTLQETLRDMPHKSGVYVMRDFLHKIIYVGKARDLKKRVSSYFSSQKKDRKTRALLESLETLEYHVVRSEAEAVLLEGRLIKDHRPKYNIAFRDDKRFLLVRVNLCDEIPKFSLTRIRKEDGARYFGPFAHAGALRKTLETLTRRFGLRSCSAATPKEEDFNHCHAHIIKNCPAPCIGKISRSDYKTRVEEACAFLEGKSAALAEELTREMKEAAGKLDFEKAATLRNLLEDVQKTTRPTKRFTRSLPTLPSAINPENDLDDLQAALDLPRRPTTMECFDISNISSTHIVASMVRFKNGVPDRKNYRTYRIKDLKTPDDFASMGEVIRRRYSRVLTEGGELPKLIIVDGGRGQLSSACKELAHLGLSDLPIIGLAKEFEEIYRPDHPLPLELDHRRGGLKLLQRIRDEAHRTANGYHSLLLKKRVRESVLDTIPGVSSSRKKILLKTFGSVERLKKTPAEEIAKTPGIGESLAQTIFLALQKKPSKPCP